MTAATYTIRDPRTSETGTVTVCADHGMGLPTASDNIKIRILDDSMSAICDVCAQDRIRALIRSVR